MLQNKAYEDFTNSRNFLICYYLALKEHGEEEIGQGTHDWVMDMGNRRNRIYFRTTKTAAARFFCGWLQFYDFDL